MGLVTAKLRETAAHVIAMSVLVLNLRKIQRALLRMPAYLLEILTQNKNWALVQWTLVRPLETGVVGHKSYILLFSYSSIRDGNQLPLSYAYGWAISADYEGCVMQTLLDKADYCMYENKRAYYATHDRRVPRS